MSIDRSVDNQHLMTMLMYTYNRSKFLNVISFEKTTLQNKKIAVKISCNKKIESRD